MDNRPACLYCQTNRRRFIGGGLALGLGLLLPTVSEAAGHFRQFTGDILVDGRKATAQTRIRPNSRIETRSGGSASFVMGNNAFLLKPDSSVHLARAQVRSGAISGFRLLSGAILGVFGPGPKKLVTTTATIGIRGTGVYFESRPESSYICLCYGAIDLNANTAPQTLQPVSATHHEARNIAAAGDIQPAGMLNHTDEELIMLEDLVGRKPPFLTA